MRTIKITIQQLLFALLTLCCVANTFAGTYNPPPVMPITDEESWQYVIAPYGWLFGANGSITVRDNPSTVDFTPIDTLERLDKVDFLYQLHLEAHKRPWAVMVDGTYIKLTENARLGPLSASISPELTLIDFGVFYTVMDLGIPATEGHVQFDIFGGGRYGRMKITLTPTRLPSLGGERDFITPTLGGRMITRPNENLGVTLRGYIGGFGVDGVKYIWSATGLVNFFITDNTAIAAGYRIVGIDYENGSGANRFAINARTYGPVIGLFFKS